jgi:hypothetical protein
MLPVYVGSWEPSRTEMYRQVFIASHRYAFTTPAIEFVGQFIGAIVCQNNNLQSCGCRDRDRLDGVLWWEERWVGESYLDESNVGGLLTEALTADVEAVLADETSRVGAHAAVSTSLATVPA